MNTTVRQSTNVTVNTIERSVTYTVNTVFQLVFRIANARGLKPDYVLRNREIIENGLFTWTSEQSLQEIFLEVYLPGDREAIERWDFQIHYQASASNEVTPPALEQLAQFCSKLEKLPARAEYCVVVQTSPGATDVPGWHPTKLRELHDNASTKLEGWGYGNVRVGFTYRGQTKA
jgi:hypothetical protein